MLRSVLAVAFALVSTAALAAPGTAVSTVNLRTEANTTSGVVAKIPAGARVDVGDCTAGWCAVAYQGKSGFAIQTALDMSGRVPARRVAGPVRRPVPGVAPYDPDDDVVYPAGPQVYYGPRPYYGPGPYWGGGPYYGYGYRGWGPRWGYRRW